MLERNRPYNTLLRDLYSLRGLGLQVLIHSTFQTHTSGIALALKARCVLNRWPGSPKRVDAQCMRSAANWRQTQLQDEVEMQTRALYLGSNSLRE